jgi:hypothetical protein
MSNQSTIETLERRLAEMERKANALVDVINDLRREDGLAPRPPFGGGGGGGTGGGTDIHVGGTTVTQIKPDTFYGKKMQTAVREFLEMRKLQNLGPATPREIYTTITAGGYQFETKDETTALVGLRALLRKRTSFFHKLPNGTYGLTSWYPDAKKPKNATSTETQDSDAGGEADGIPEASPKTATAS